MHRLFISSSIRKVSFRRFLLLFPSSLSFFGCLICVETQIILIRFHANIRYLHIIGFLKPSAVVYVFKIIYVPIMSTSACRSRFFSPTMKLRWDGAFLCFKRIVADKSYNNMKAPPRAAWSRAIKWNLMHLYLIPYLWAIVVSFSQPWWTKTFLHMSRFLKGERCNLHYALFLSQRRV